MATIHSSTIPDSDNSHLAYTQHGELITIPPQLHSAWRGTRPLHGLLQPVGNGYGQFLLKPSGGIWTSTLIGENESAFTRLCESFDGNHEWAGKPRWKLTPIGDLAVYVADTDEDFGKLFREDWDKGINHSDEDRVAAWSGDDAAIERMRRMPSYINWKKFARYFDCLWARGYFPPAWDCESLFWTRWCFTAPQFVGGAR